MLWLYHRPSMQRLILVEEQSTDVGRRHALPDGGQATLGRDESCAIRLGEGEARVSRRHAALQAEGDGFWLADLKSANGTFVNQQRIESVWLQAGDVIELGAGGPRLRVLIEGPAAPATAAASAPPPTPAGPPLPVTAAPMPASRTVAPARPESGTTAELGVAPTAPRRAALADATLFDPARHAPERGSLLGVVVVIAMLGLGGLLGALVLLMNAFSLPLTAAIVGTVVAFAPAPIYITLWLWLDRYDPEPAWALAGVLVWGAGAATFVSAIANTLFGAAVLEVTHHQAAAEFLSASISAPLVEEATKGIAVLLIYLVLRREFDGVLDGVVYAGIVALGFATVENVLYYGRGMAKGGTETLIGIFILRGVLGPFGHAVFTSMTGIGCGIARQSHNMAVRLVAPVAGYFGAVLLHFLWNTLAGLVGSIGGFLLLYLFFWMPLFLVFLGGVLWIGRRETLLIRRMLAAEVALGLLTAEQARIVGSWPRRVGWLLGTLGDWARLKARRRFLSAATRLALSYWHAERASQAGAVTVSAGMLPVFRGEVARLKALV
jgi:RsiW-degrading membrane proteinase PrsW (M82 family)